MTPMRTTLTVLLCALSALSHADGAAQTMPSPRDREGFISQARATAARFVKPAAAMRAGFRRLGPDFPGMGQHWVHPGRIVSGRLDAGSPAVLSYARRKDGELVLVGLAWAVPLGPDEAPPIEPFGPDAWHDHTAAVDEEVLLLGHAAGQADTPYSFRLSMVHVWTELDNPDGILAQNNWALPFWRNGLDVPDPVSRAAARAVSLAYEGRDFYRELLEQAVELPADQHQRVMAALDAEAGHAESLIERLRIDRDVPLTEYEVIWYALWNAIREAVSPENWEHLARFAEAD